MRRSAISRRSSAISTAARRRPTAKSLGFAEFLSSPDVEQFHFIGKDIVYFHTLFWPAMLKFAGAPYKVPTNVFVHGFLTALGEKMSKSRGTGISPDYYLDLGFDAEWLRYYIAAKLNDKVEDIDFNPDDFVARVNSDLVGKYVNIASRAARLSRAISTTGLSRVRQTGSKSRTDRLDDRLHRLRRNPLRRLTRIANLARHCARSWDRRRVESSISTGKAMGARRRTRQERAERMTLLGCLDDFRVLTRC